MVSDTNIIDVEGQGRQEPHYTGALNDNISEKSYVIVDSASGEEKAQDTIVEDEEEEYGNEGKVPAGQKEIEYIYLEFDTPLPTPANVSSPQPGQSAPPPPCPNLKKYASPFLWPSFRKSVTTVICCLVTMMASYSAGEYTPPSQQLMDKWHVSRVVYNLGITLYTLGFGTAPMVLAPFSEFNGRRPIFILSGVLFTGERSTFFICSNFRLTAMIYIYSMLGRVRRHKILCRTAHCSVFPGCWGINIFDHGGRYHKRHLSRGESQRPHGLVLRGRPFRNGTRSRGDGFHSVPDVVAMDLLLAGYFQWGIGPDDGLLHERDSWQCAS